MLQYRDRHQEGERDARIFEAFERGLSPARTVIELRMDAATVQALHKVWLAMTDSVVFSPAEGVSRREWERTWGVAVTARNVAKALQIVAAHPELRQCLEPCVKAEGHERTALAVGT